MQHPFVHIATEAARSASKIILSFIDRLHSIEIKEKVVNDVVTEVDQMAEETIIEHIKKAYPDHAILAEESGLMEGNEYCWVIDPLDGSTNYIHGFPHYAISIAVKKEKSIEAGIVYDPIRHELFSAVHGQGAYLDNRRIRVSECKKLESALVGTGFPFRKKQHIKPYMTIFESIFLNVSGIRRAGAAALDLAYVAAGRLDGFWEASLNEWDMAAGALLIQEAGGLMTDFHGTDQHLFAGNVVAGSPKIQRGLLEIIGKSLKE